MIFLKDEVDRLELVLRKDNLKFLGILETAQESYEACVQKVVDVLNDAGELAIPFTASDIQQAYRINGRRRRNEPRPLIVKFTHWCDKLEILMNKEIRDQLRHNGVRVANDLTRRQSSALAEIRRQGKVGYFLNGKLRVAERQSRVSENDNDSRYAPHDRQINSRGQHWKDYQHYGSSGRASNAPPQTEDPLTTTTTGTALRTRWTTQKHSKQRAVHLPTTSNATSATTVRNVVQATATHVSVTP